MRHRTTLLILITCNMSRRNVRKNAKSRVFVPRRPRQASIARLRVQRACTGHAAGMAQHRGTVRADKPKALVSVIRSLLLATEGHRRSPERGRLRRRDLVRASRPLAGVDLAPEIIEALLPRDRRLPVGVRRDAVNVGARVGGPAPAL